MSFPGRRDQGLGTLLALTVAVVAVATVATLPGAAAGAAPAAHHRHASTRINVETYNILGSDHPEGGRRIGGEARDRAKRATRIIRGRDGAPAADIVGVQELTVHQRDLFDHDLPGYDAVPSSGDRPGNTIYYLRSRFRLLGEGKFAYPYYDDRGLQDGHGTGRWAALQLRSTGRRILAVDVHAVAFNRQQGSDPGGAEKREATAKAVDRLVARAHKTRPGAQVVVTGDWNSTNNIRGDYPRGAHDKAIQGHRSDLPYCVLTKSPQLLQDSRDALHHRTGHCPDRSRSGVRDSTIDWVYVSPGTHITRWMRIDTPESRMASDHNPVLTTLALR